MQNYNQDIYAEKQDGSYFDKMREFFDLDEGVTREQMVTMIDSLSMKQKPVEEQKKEATAILFDKEREYVFSAYDEFLYEKVKSSTTYIFNQIGDVKAAKNLILNITTYEKRGILPKIIIDNLGQIWTIKG